ncbi:TolC family protein, partial [Mycobacterium tuberculosis]|nr:TolC family protein [Mycobacterium tuberculosis]
RLNGAVGVGGPTATTPFGLAGGPSLQMPLFDYGRRQTVLHARRALLEEALAGYQQTVLTAYEEASNALAQWRAASIAAAAEAET